MDLALETLLSRRLITRISTLTPEFQDSEFTQRILDRLVALEGGEAPPAPGFRIDYGPYEITAAGWDHLRKTDQAKQAQAAAATPSG